MTPIEAAKRLDGGEYGKEGSKELFAEMKAAGLVAVFGASDDLMEFEGAIYEEFGAFEGRTAYVTGHGRASEKRLRDSASIKAIGCAKDEPCWTFKTNIPHETFLISEDGEPFCRGIVFSLTDVSAAPAIPA